MKRLVISSILYMYSITKDVSQKFTYIHVSMFFQIIITDRIHYWYTLVR